MHVSALSPRLTLTRMRATALGAAIVAAVAVPGVAQAQPAETGDAIQRYLAAHPEALASAVETYLTAHPEVIRAALVALAAKRVTVQSGAAVADASQAIAANEKALYAAPLQTLIGAADGAPTMVEFFDFNCGFCRKALSDKLALIADEPRLRIILKEFPIMGPDSVEAAKVAMALQMRHPSPAASLEFHRRLLASPGRVDGAAALTVARDLGFDAAQLEKDAASAEVSGALQENTRVASALGIRGTPAYIIGTSVIPGAIGAAALKARIGALKSEVK